MLKTIAKSISIIFHPVLIPTIGFILLFNSGFYFSMLSWEVKRFILLAVFFSTGLLPLLTFSILAINPRFNINFDKPTDRILPLLFSAAYYLLGYYLLYRLPIYPVFRIFLLSTVLVIILLLFISFKWKISNHMAGIGGLLGTFLALSFRMGINPVFEIIGLVMLAGAVGTSRMLLGKHDVPQILGGFTLGFTILYLIIFFS